MKAGSFLAVKYQNLLKRKKDLFSPLLKKMLFASTVNSVADEGCNNNRKNKNIIKTFQNHCR